MKILHLPTDTGGCAWGLANAEKELGLHSSVLVKQSSWLDYPYDINLNWDNKGKLRKCLQAFSTILKIRQGYDCLHFNFGSSLIDPSFFPLFDLMFYSKNKIFFTYNGCDARQKYKTLQRVSCAACHEPMCYGGMCNDGTLDALRERKIRKASKYASAIFAVNPDLLWVLPKHARFLPYSIASWGKLSPAPYRIDQKIKVVHAPTNRVVKGSKYILAALDLLKKKYQNLEVILLESVPNHRALEVYKQAHLIIDQVMIGWYGALAVEAMKLGKPVAVNIREEDLRFIPSQMAQDLKKAIIQITPTTIVAALETFLQNPSLLVEKHEAALDYVNVWHNPSYVAGITKEAYEKAVSG